MKRVGRAVSTRSSGIWTDLLHGSKGRLPLADLMSARHAGRMEETRTSAGLVVLERDECLRLLREHHLGRLAFVVDNQPLIFPLNYSMSGTDVVFRSDDGLKMSHALNHAVAFEIDGVNALFHEGWNVLVLGTMCEETNSVLIRELEAVPLGTWVPGPTPHWVRIRSTAISGRRISHSNPTNP